jgi:hypothetical protein
MSWIHIGQDKLIIEWVLKIKIYLYMKPKKYMWNVLSLICISIYIVVVKTRIDPLNLFSLMFLKFNHYHP